MDNRFFSQQSDQIENGGMFTREQIQRLTEYLYVYQGKSWNYMGVAVKTNLNQVIWPAVWLILIEEWTSISFQLGMNFLVSQEFSIRARKGK